MGDLASKTGASVTLTSSGSSLSSGSGAAASVDFDCRTAGNFANDFQVVFELVGQWSTITNIVAGTIATEIYMVASLDGTNFPDVDLTASSSRAQYNAYVGIFEFPKAPTASTNLRFISTSVDLMPLLYRVYIINRSGQTMSAAWTLKAVSARGQYT